MHQANGSPIAQEALTRIGVLYAIEAQGRNLSVEERGQLRAREAKLEIMALFTWLIEIRAKVAQGSATAKAMDYTLKRRVALCRYAESGHLPIDNNPVENAIRPIAIGKKPGRAVGGGDPEPVRHRQAQWPGPLCLAA